MPKRVVVNILLSLFVLAPFNSISNIAFYHYGTEKGLTESRILSITQDSVGFIWLAGEYSLTRFDGNQFKLYKNSNQSPLPWNKVNCDFTDSDGTLWVGSERGFSYYNFEKDRFAVPASGLEGMYISDFTEGPDRKIWIATDQGVARYDKNTKQITWVTGNKSLFDTLNNSFPGESIKCISSQPDGKIWIVPTSNGLYQLNPENGKIKHFASIDEINIDRFNITDIRFSDEKLLLSTESNGFFLLQSEKNLVKKFIIGYLTNAIYHIQVDNDSTVWLGTGGGLYRLNHKSGELTQYSNILEDPLSMQSTTTKFVFVDREKNLWVTSGIRGIEYGLNNTIFNHFMYAENVPYCLTRKEVVSIDFDKSGNLWMGYESGLLEKHSSNPFSKTGYYLPSKNNYGGRGSAFRVFEDSKNRIWAGGWRSGLQKFNRKENLFQWVSVKPDSIAQKIEMVNILDILEGPDHNLWVSTSGNGIFKYNPITETAKFFERNENIPTSGPSDNYTSSLCLDKQNNLWIASAHGLSKLDLKSEQFTSYFHDAKDSVTLSGNAIQTMHCDKSGLIWAGTSNGLNVFIPELNNFKPIKTDLDDSFLNISAIESVKSGEIWVSTKSGLFCLTYSLDNGLKEMEYKIEYYYNSNGLISNSYYDRSSTTDDNGMIYFGGNEGVDFFNPEASRKDLYKQPKAIITDVSVYGKPIYPQTDKSSAESPFFKIDYDQRMISIRFTSLNFTNPDQQKFRYKLEGFDKQWVFPQEEKVATYTNMRPGNYLFVVETMDKNGLWSENQSSVRLKINPPIWLTIPFLIASSILFIAIIYFISWARSRMLIIRQKQLEQVITERTNELLEKNQELEEANYTKTKFFSIISHDLKSPFSGLLGLLELLNTPDMVPPDKKDELIQAANNSARNTYNLLENLLIWSRSQTEKLDYTPQSLNLPELLENNIVLLSETAKQKNIEVKKEFPAKCIVEADQNMLNTVIRNLLSNAIKFTNSGGTVTIHSNIIENMVEIKIEDNGVGIKNTHIEHLFTTRMNQREGTSGESGTGLGLMICKEFVTTIGGKIWVTQNYPQGSVFHFTVPVSTEKN